MKSNQNILQLSLCKESENNTKLSKKLVDFEIFLSKISLFA